MPFHFTLSDLVNFYFKNKNNKNKNKNLYSAMKSKDTETLGVTLR